MAFKDIEKAILDEAQKSADEHKKVGEQKSAEIIQEWEKKAVEKKQTIVETTKRKINQRIQQAQFKIQNRTQLSVLEKKQAIIDRVYQAVLGKLSNLSENEYVDLMEKLINSLPESSATLLSAKGKESLLEKALKKAQKKHQISSESIESQGGFIYQSDKIEINQSFESLIENAKEKTILSVINKVFN